MEIEENKEGQVIANGPYPTDQEGKLNVRVE